MAPTRVFCQHAVFSICFPFCIELTEKNDDDCLLLIVISNRKEQRLTVQTLFPLCTRVYQAAASRLKSGFATELTAIDGIVQKINKYPRQRVALCLSTQVYKQAGDCRDITNNLVVAHTEFQSVEVSAARSRHRVGNSRVASRMSSVNS